MSSYNQKICFVIPSFSFGGAERVVTVLASQLASDGYDIAIIKYFETANEYPTSEKVEVFCVSQGTETLYHELSFVERIRRIRKILKQIRPNYIVPFLPHVAAHVFLAGIGLRIRMVQTIRVAPNVAPASHLLRCIRNVLVAISYVTFVQTEKQKAYFPTWMQRRIVVLPNPVSQAMIETNPRYHGEIIRIVSVGRLTEQKNFEMLIEAVANISKMGYPVKLNIYGEGELKQSLQALIDSLCCQNVCQLRGRTNNVPKVLGAADLFVLASNYEGMPNALMEAMAVGLPCISTDCETGPGDLLGAGRGILVPVNDRNAMTKAIQLLMDEPQKAAEMGCRAKEYMREQYSPAVISKHFMQDVIMRGTKNGYCKKNI